MPMRLTRLVATANALNESSSGFLEFIDGLREAGYSTFPKFSAAGRFISMRIGHTELRSMTLGGLSDAMDPPFRFYRSATGHDPVLREIAAAHEAGRDQPQILDSAGEVAIAHARAPGPHDISHVIYNAIDRCRSKPDAALHLPAILDHFSPMSREELVRIAEPLVDDQDSFENIMLMPGPHCDAALRWLCRGMPAQAAILRQEDRISRDTSLAVELPSP